MPHSHILLVRTLYKYILRLHKGLPQDLRFLGDEYVRSEFKRHKDAPPQFVSQFMNEWTTYAVTLRKQLEDSDPKIGENLPPDFVHQLDDDQVLQLYALKKESEQKTTSNKQDRIDRQTFL